MLTKGGLSLPVIERLRIEQELAWTVKAILYNMLKKYGKLKEAEDWNKQANKLLESGSYGTLLKKAMEIAQAMGEKFVEELKQEVKKRTKPKYPIPLTMLTKATKSKPQKSTEEFFISQKTLLYTGVGLLALILLILLLK